MKSITPAMAAHLLQDATTLATCWRIVRRDGQVFAFTDLDRAITYDGQVYEARSGFMRSAVSNSATLGSDDLEVRGFLDSASITENDLRLGHFDYAEVFIFMVNYEDLSMGHVNIRYGRFGESKLDKSGNFQIELRGLIRQLSHTIGRRYSADCRTDLFSAQCKLNEVAPMRQNGQAYAVGDRVTTRFNAPDRIYRLPVLNGNFQVISAGGTEQWALTDALIHSPRPGFSVRNVRPTAWVSDTRQAVDIGTLFGALAVEGTATFTVTQLTDTRYQRARLAVWCYNDALEELSFTTDGYSTPSGTAQSRSMSVTLPVGTSRIVAAIQTQKRNTEGSPTTDPFTPDATNVFMSPQMNVVIPGVTTGSQVLLDTGFMAVQLGAATAANWMLSGGNLYSNRYGFFGPGGRPFVMPFRPHDDKVIASSSDIDLAAAGVTPAMLATGDYEIVIEWEQANVDINGEMGIRPRWRATGHQDGQTAVRYTPTIPVREWQPRQQVNTIPAWAQRVVLEAYGRRSGGSEMTGAPWVAFTGAQAYVRHKEATTYDYQLFGGVEFECIGAGTTGDDAALVFPTAVGSEIVDGGVTWRAVLPTYSNLAQITEVTSRGLFKVSGVAREDNYFQWGLMRFMSGVCEGQTMEVVRWDQATQEVGLVLPVPLSPAVGDWVWLQAGCDKSIETCQAKFGNAINFRGEPYLPGTDQYFRVGSPVGTSSRT